MCLASAERIPACMLWEICVCLTQRRGFRRRKCYAVNQGLPGDIVVQKSEEVPLGYHPRKCNNEKTYEYVIYNNRLPNPVERLYSYFFICRWMWIR